MKAEEFKELVDAICKDNKLTYRELSLMIGKKNENYISQSLSKGIVSESVLKLLENLFPNNKTSTLNDIEVLKKSVDVLLKEMAKITAKGGDASSRLTELKQEIAMQIQLGTS